MIFGFFNPVWTTLPKGNGPGGNWHQTLDFGEGAGAKTGVSATKPTSATLAGNPKWTLSGPGCGPTAVVHSFCGGVGVDYGPNTDNTGADACGPGDCKTWLCDGGTGQYTWSDAADGTSCNDGSPCTLMDTCNGGQCAGLAVNCDDKSACTIDSCFEFTGACLHITKPQVGNGVTCTGCATGIAGPECSTCVDANKAGTLCKGCMDAKFTGDKCATPVPSGWALINAGAVRLGCDDESKAAGLCFIAETLPYETTLTHSFLMQTEEVSRAQWVATMGSAPAQSVDCGESCPVTGINRWDAMSFANALSTQDGRPPCYVLVGCTGKVGVDLKCQDWKLTSSCVKPHPYPSPQLKHGYRLPTEAQWEFAARAGTKGKAYGPLNQIAWWEGNGDGALHPSAKHKANGFGMHDMIGNAWEWVEDCPVWGPVTADWASAYLGSGQKSLGLKMIHSQGQLLCGWTSSSAWGFSPWYEVGYASPQACVFEPKCAGAGVLRGCSWRDSEFTCRASYRWEVPPDARLYTAGLRLVRWP